MDGFLGFKCGPSCSEKQHNKDIKALIDAIDDLLAYDSKTKKELGATEPGVTDARREAFSDRLGDIKDRADDLRGTHRFRPFTSSDQSVVGDCDAALRGLGATADSAGRREVEADIWQNGGLLQKDRDDFGHYRGSLASSHDWRGFTNPPREEVPWGVSGGGNPWLE